MELLEKQNPADYWIIREARGALAGSDAMARQAVVAPSP
jgi:hypothetical protein